jgi:hypothetical protein
MNVKPSTKLSEVRKYLPGVEEYKFYFNDAIYVN